MSQKTGAIVLAGGRSKRFGADKRAASLSGRTLFDRAIDNACQQASVVIVSASILNNAPAPIPHGLPLVFDETPDQGPLAGVSAGLNWFHEHQCDIPRVAIFCADTPFLPADFVARLNTAHTGRIALSHYGKRAHYTCAGFPVAAHQALTEFLATGARRAEDFIRSFGYDEIDFSQLEEDPFFNINTAEDLKTANARFSAKS